MIIPSSDKAALTLEANANLLIPHYLFEYSKSFPLSYTFYKENQVAFANECGFHVPKSWILNESFDIPKDIIYPCIIKPLVSCEGSKSDIKICNNQDELVYNLGHLEFTKEAIIQQYIIRDFEISLIGCSLTDGECMLPAVEKKLTLFPKYVGLECLSYMQKLENEQLMDCVKALIHKIGYVGLFSVEMMHCKADGHYYFTEINLRNDGAQPFMCKFGYNLPLNHVEDLCGLPLTPNQKEHPGYYIWEGFHLASLKAGDITIKQWISELMKCRGFLLWQIKDLRPFFMQFLSSFLLRLHLREGGVY